MYSQNNEEEIIVNYFQGQDKTNLYLLDIGANDGKTFSNSLRAIEMGWSGCLVEPSPKAFKLLSALHNGNESVKLIDGAISKQGGMFELMESSSLSHLDATLNNDVALVSSLISSETEKWRTAKVGFKSVMVMCRTFAGLLWELGIYKFDLITIDVEGKDYEVLSQINLTQVGCQMLIVEWNGKDRDKYVNYCTKHNLVLTSENPENLIFVKPK